MRKALLLIILGTFLISACSNKENTSKNPTPSPKKEEQVVDDSTNTEQVEKEKQRVELSFEPVKNDQQIKEVSQINSERIVQELPVSVGKIVIYTKKNDEEYHYGAFVNQNKTFDLGVVSGRHPDNINIQELKLYHKYLVRIDGVFGTHASVHNYFEIDIEAKKIKPFLKVDTGNAKEVDLEGDGISEIVSLGSTPTSAYIYKWDDGALKVGDVNEALGALHVRHIEDNLFRVLFKGSEEIEMYEYKKPGILELQNKEASSQNTNEDETSTQLHKEETDVTQLPDQVDLSFTPLEQESLERGEKLESWESVKSIPLGSMKGKSLTLHVFNETNQDNVCSDSYESVSLIEYNDQTYKLPNCTSDSLEEENLEQTVYTSQDLSEQEGRKQKIVAGFELAANGPGRILYVVYDSAGQKLWSFVDWGVPKVVDLDQSGNREFVNQFPGLHTHAPDVTLYRWVNGTLQKSPSLKKELGITNYSQNQVSLKRKNDTYLFEVSILTDFEKRTYQNVRYKYENGKLQLGHRDRFIVPEHANNKNITRSVFEYKYDITHRIAVH